MTTDELSIGEVGATVAAPPSMRSVPCNLCGANDVRTIRESAGTGRIVQCRQCGLAYVSPRPRHDPRRQYEGDEYHEKRGRRGLAVRGPGYRSYAADAIVLRPYFERMAREVAHLKPGARLLEVGAARGYFLEAARDEGLRPEAIEPSKACQHWIRDALRLPVVAGSLEEAALDPGTYDVVALFQTIEHLDDPRSGLLKIARWLKPGGLIVLTTPNRRGWLARLSGKRWFEYRPQEHLTYFDAKTIAKMLESVGFDRISVERDVGRYSLSFLLQRLGQHHSMLRPLAGLLQRVVPGALKDRSIPLHYGSMKVTAYRAGMVQ